MVNDNIKARISDVREKIASAAARAGRDASEVKLVGVTKTRTVEEMLEAAPLIDFIGENRIQEAVLKKQDWPENIVLEWRMIGHLQSNKVRKALTLFDTVDSLDSVGLAQTVERVAADLDRTVSVLVEVNTSGENSKTGVDPDAFMELLDRVLSYPHLNLQGLMTIGPLTDNETQVRKAFAHLREMTFQARLRSGLPLPVISMGMSGDFEWAILEGSTMVRIGTSLFGAR